MAAGREERGGDRPTGMFYIKTGSFRSLELTILASLQSSRWKAHDKIPNNAFSSLIPDTHRCCDHTKSQELLTETEPLTLTAEVFCRWGFLGSVLFHFLERERGRQCSPFSWNILTEDPILSPPAGPCCCSAHCWGLNQNTSTPDGWGRTHPGFIKKKLPHLFKVLTSWSCMFLFSENAASPSCLSQFTRLLWNTLKVEPQD